MLPDDPDAREANREFIRALFEPRDLAPADVVAPSGLTREDLLAQNDSAGTWAEVRIPGEPVCDVDGVPSGVTADRLEVVYRGGAVVTLDQLAAVGLTPQDVPKLHIIEPPHC